MTHRLDQARELESRANAAASLAEAQALKAQADRLRGARGGTGTGWPLIPYFRN
ncbi:hypothetical protein ACFQ1E_11485 [Sphingomonas canadensis]|uniref:Uncharacterized protein n=2 Tax=Sphingomonas canadensis TaxID=1219257 RepID=A0ABW3H737_9SPHN|nr:hypothetical protein [Sphingomonas canadensis]